MAKPKPYGPTTHTFIPKNDVVLIDLLMGYPSSLCSRDDTTT